MKRYFKSAFFSALLLVFTSAADPQKTIVPADVLSGAKQVREEVELLRHEMGRPQKATPLFLVSNAAPREVYFQALSLLRKANQLSYENLRIIGPVPEAPKDAIQPKDVLSIVDIANERILQVKKSLNIEKEIKREIQPAKTQPTDVFNEIILVNRQLNALLDKQVNESDVYEQLNLAVNYAERLLDLYPNVRSVPELPAFTPGKTPQDVLKTLITCFNLIQEIAGNIGTEVLDFNIVETSYDSVDANDLYDITSLLVSELAFFQKTLNADAPADTYYPGKKFSSHVYQLATLLQEQLQLLVQVTSKDKS